MPRLASWKLRRQSSLWAKEPLATIQEIEAPSCRDGWVTIRSASFEEQQGKSSNDIVVFNDDDAPQNMIQESTTRPGDDSCSSALAILTTHLNREMAGVVEEVGMGVSQFAKGQRVIPMPSTSAYDCLYEYNDHTHDHEECQAALKKLGVAGSNDIFSAPSSYLYPLPSSISLQSAACLSALATAYHAFLHILPFQPFDNVLILSSNRISLFLVRLLSLRKVCQIIVAEHNPILKRLASQFGATHVLDPADLDVPESVRLLTDDLGADVVFQTADHREDDDSENQDAFAITNIYSNTLKRRREKSEACSAISACRSRGTVVNIAPREMYEARKVKFRNHLSVREVQYMGSAGYDVASLKAAVRLMASGDMSLEGMVRE